MITEKLRAIESVTTPPSGFVTWFFNEDAEPMYKDSAGNSLPFLGLTHLTQVPIDPNLVTQEMAGRLLMLDYTTGRGVLTATELVNSIRLVTKPVLGVLVDVIGSTAYVKKPTYDSLILKAGSSSIALDGSESQVMLFYKTAMLPYDNGEVIPLLDLWDFNSMAVLDPDLQMWGMYGQFYQAYETSAFSEDARLVKSGEVKGYLAGS